MYFSGGAQKHLEKRIVNTKKAGGNFMILMLSKANLAPVIGNLLFHLQKPLVFTEPERCFALYQLDACEVNT